ncbi:MAG: nuclear transport factor 2 family protein [Candidatus Nitronauta litoralis]|uniref:Nuclear transport factor 2 family protein n=1 Tax=Candidatus Nitronauta litoralis TaxID=2705533 RepID=A0A7T0G0H6_9BACT|nr:MAG: nuclear transport factor 2 family protein [Candidatus Nitronauta litoralis]
MKASPETRDEIKNVLDKYFESYLKGQLDDVITHYSPEPDTTLINSGLEEKQIGRENIRSRIEQSLNQKEKITSLKYHNLMVSEKDTVAWISSDLEARLAWEDQEINLMLRLTGVFVKEKNNWLITQMHSSAPFTMEKHED